MGSLKSATLNSAALNPAASAEQPLSRMDRVGLALLLLAAIAFGALVELRSAFLSRRMGDLGVYLRGAWAVRAGTGIYDITDNNNWHYCYPPLLAVLMVPLADPPSDVEASWIVPYAVAVAVCYVLSLVFLALATHWLACALEEIYFRGQRIGCRRWWALRCLPVLVCLPPIGTTLSRGQVNTLVLALLCGMLAWLLRGRSFRAGLCLAGAICIKVIPAMLLLYPLWRRDVRFLAGCSFGLFLGLVLIPVMVLGPARTWHEYQTYAEVLLGPALGLGDDASRHKELLGAGATDSQSFQSILHHVLHPDSATRPPNFAAWEVGAHALLSIAFTTVTLAAAGRRRQTSPLRHVYALGGLSLLMTVCSPASHLHYFTFCLPMVTALLVQSWKGRSDLRVSRGLAFVLCLFCLGNALPLLPGLRLLQEIGVAAYASLGLWLVVTWRAWIGEPAAAQAQSTHRLLAA